MNKQSIPTAEAMQFMPRQVTRLDIIAAEVRQETAESSKLVTLLQRVGGMAIDGCYYLGLDRILPPYRARQE